MSQCITCWEPGTEWRGEEGPYCVRCVPIMDQAMTDKPTADKARLREIRAKAVRAMAALRVSIRTAWNDDLSEPGSVERARHAGRVESMDIAIDVIEALLVEADAALARAEATEINLRSVMKRSNHWQSRAEAAEKERDELLKHCTALERESFENLIKHEKWQEREAVYRSQIEAGAKRIEAAEKALEAVKEELAWMRGRAEWFAHSVVSTDGVSISTELDHWQRRILSAAGGQQEPVAAPLLTERGRPCVPCGGTGIARRRSCLACNGTGTDSAGGQ
jgi:chromosome segregation ATPase